MQLIPGTEKIQIKKAFEERYRSLLGKEYEEFLKYSLSFLRRSIRVNTLKISVEEIKERLSKDWKLTQIPWCKEGFWIEGERRDIGNLTEHMLGYFYVQEAASMIPPTVLKPEETDIVLDMCAAPGSKTTQMAAMMNNKGVLMANDQKGLRLRALGLNLQRAGITNTMITLMNGISFKNKEIKFDKILLDAPCSGTGTIRRSLKTLQDWNPVAIKRLAGMQRQLIEAAFSVLKEDGIMVYSTCSLEPEEDEGIINHLIENNENAKIEKIKTSEFHHSVNSGQGGILSVIKCQKSKGFLSTVKNQQSRFLMNHRDQRGDDKVMPSEYSPVVFDINAKTSALFTEFEKVRYSEEVKKCLRIWPQDNDTDGFFVARIRKEA